MHPLIRLAGFLSLLLVVAGCTSSGKTDRTQPLADARRGFKTHLVPQQGAHEPAEPPPPEVFRAVRYPAPSGNLSAYLSPAPKDGKNHPAIVWITGGDCNSIGDVWSPAPLSNDQTAAAFRNAGILMMFPSLRGGNDNPGTKEGFLGEVDDVMAAAAFLARQPGVDPKRIYLGGHSTGGTLALLVAEVTDRFRGVFAFGAVDDVSLYRPSTGFVPFDPSNSREVELRSPGFWLASIQSPTWVIEGADGNIEALRVMAKASTNPKVQFVEIPGADHFAGLAPTNSLIAKKILQDTGEAPSISLTTGEAFQNFVRSTRGAPVR